MRTAERHQVGAAGGQDGIDLICGGDIADAHGGDAGLVADLLGKRGLEHTAIDRLGVAHGLAGGDIDQIDAGFRKGARDLTASSPVMPPSAQSVAEMRTDIGLCAGQAARNASNTSSGKRRRPSSEPP